MSIQNDNMALVAERELIDVVVSGRASEEDLAEVFSLLTADDFLSPQCSLAFATSVEAFSVSGTISKGSLIEALSHTVSPHKSAVIDMLNEAPPHTMATGFDSRTLSKVVREMSDRRKIEALVSGFSDEDDSASMSTKVMDGISAIAMSQGDGGQSNIIDEKDEFMKFVLGKTKESVVPLGLSKLDRMLSGGVRPGQFIILGARPAHGKSTLGLNFAQNIAYGMGGNVMFFSLEMSNSEISHKILSSGADVKLDHIRQQSIEEGSEDYRKLEEYFQQMEDSGGNIFVDATPNNSAAAISAAIKARMLKDEVDIVLIDYLQLMVGKNVESRQAEVSAISRSMKLLAKQLQIPIICMSQLNRNSTQKTGEIRQPVIADLRESGSLEQDADVIILIGEPKGKDGDKAEGDDDFSENITVPLFLSKQRNGPTGEIRTIPLLAYSKFVAAEDGPEEVPDFLSGNVSVEESHDVDDNADPVWAPPSNKVDDEVDEEMLPW